MSVIEKVEIFAVGKWNGYLFSLKDLGDIVSAFRALRTLHKVPLKFGHDDNQPLTDGLFAIGWVDNVWIETGLDGSPKLFARFIDVPTLVYDAVTKNLYSKVSIELDGNVKHKDSFYRYVLSGVALLGAALPAVNTLADIGQYIMSKAVFTVEGDRFNFSMTNKEAIMPISEEEMKARLKAQEEQLKAKFTVEKQEKEIAAKKELDESKEKVISFEKEKKEREALAEKTKIKLARETVVKVLNEAVKGLSITPAQKETYSSMLKVDDDVAVVGIDVDELKKMVGVKKLSKEHAMDEGEKTKHEDAGEELDFKTREYMDDHPKINYSRALERVMQKNPELAKNHMLATEEEL